MGFFRRFTQGMGHATRVAGLAEAASSWGWEAAGDDPFAAGLTDAIHGVARAQHGTFRAIAGSKDLMVAGTRYRDAYRATVDGRAVTVANAWITIEAVVAGGRRAVGSGVVAVEPRRSC